MDFSLQVYHTRHKSTFLLPAIEWVLDFIQKEMEIDMEMRRASHTNVIDFIDLVTVDEFRFCDEFVNEQQLTQTFVEIMCTLVVKLINHQQFMNRFFKGIHQCEWEKVSSHAIQMDGFIVH